MNYIFDFDGTVADSLDAVIDIANEIGAGMGLHVDKDEVDTYRKMSSIQVVRHFRIPLWRLPRLLTKGMRLFKDRIPSIKTFPGLPATLADMQQRGDRLYMLTSNNDKNVREFLEARGIARYFDRVYTGSSLFGKAGHLKRIMRELKLKPDNTVYIGDETRDIQAAKKAGLRIVSVTWGFNHVSILEQYDPDYLIDKPAELLNVT
jgi:phosphoglycolate phosphatase